MTVTQWPVDDATLVALQRRIARDAERERQGRRYEPRAHDLLGGCFVAYATGEAGPGHPGDRAWAAAVSWRPTGAVRDEGAALRGTSHADGPRVARDLEEQVVVAGTVPASYAPGLLAQREGPLLEEAVSSLAVTPEVLLVDATGLDHPRCAGLAVHLGWALDLPTVGVTHRPLHADDDTTLPDPERGSTSAIRSDESLVAHWVRTATGARPVVAHAGWRTTPATAAAVVLLASTPASRTPVPLGEARRAAREARAIASGTWG